MSKNNRNTICLDVGDKRVGVAKAAPANMLPQPLCTIERAPGFWEKLQEIIEDQAPVTIVIGLPRNLSGDETPQTAKVRQFAGELKIKTGISEVEFQDEALSSRLAEEELRQRGVVGDKKAVDALAAAYILKDYVNDKISASTAK